MRDEYDFSKGIRGPINRRHGGLWGLQFVWWGKYPGHWMKWPWVGSGGPWPIDGAHKGFVYDWRFYFGPVEVRHFTNKTTKS